MLHDFSGYFDRLASESKVLLEEYEPLLAFAEGWKMDPRGYIIPAAIQNVGEDLSLWILVY